MMGIMMLLIFATLLLTMGTNDSKSDDSNNSNVYEH